MEICFGSTYTKELCNKHIKNHPYKCYKCKFECNNKESLKEHERSQHDFLKFLDTTSDNFNKERIQNDEVIMFPCNYCGNMFGIKEDLDVHLMTHQEQIKPKEKGNQSMRINCDQCQYFAADVSTFVRHKEINTQLSTVTTVNLWRTYKHI